MTSKTAPTQASQPSKGRVEGSFHSPFIDFLMLGGASLIMIPILLLLTMGEKDTTPILIIAIILSYVINNPHFAHSYQIFYRNFRQKMRGEDLPKSIHLRYIFSGVIFPILAILFYGYALLTSNWLLIGNSVNIMFFFVGWHYVKQGYGIAIVCAVLKKNFFTAREKNILIFNAYAVWVLTWLGTNLVISKGDYFGLEYYSFALPQSFFLAALVAATLTTVLAIDMFVRKYIQTRKEKPFPVNGAIAYFCALYTWTLLASINPFYMLIIPAFHSLQYLAVVWRYEYNRLRDEEQQSATPTVTARLGGLFRTYFKDQTKALLLGHILIGIILGILGFFSLPYVADYIAVNMGLNVASATTPVYVFMVIFWVFINVHHYFIDNVIWKKENPEIKQHLFS